MEVRLVKDELNKCYRGEGVNAQQYCKDLAERYVSMLKENRVSCDLWPFSASATGVWPLAPAADPYCAHN